ncbi:RNA polymerase subunit sigma-70 [Wenjunlia vitaminophila]|uniref:RNA polymerase subunit sigma-70 n=1 Tax=Wenjunlia vitaminophila TaxID=76728 RepID=A0A0T6LYH4_WENVI|nr:sigma-70 family RNA polymerase sigma factor [Wenjunlia vitaminophila]KRV51114.1 RNA polymerase subunit sigma-70 [Wenjunlia vitaminophila]
MDEQEFLAERFEQHRSRLRAVAYRLLGSLAEADDAVQETWLRITRAGTDGVENLDGWMTTIVARISLNMLRSRSTRAEKPLEGTRLPDPVVTRYDEVDPEQQVLLADSVGLALLVVLDTLSPAERLAFVLHDTFGLPFDEIAPVVGRTPAATRQLASRARRRVRGAAPDPDADVTRQREVVDAFLAAARDGDFEGLLAVLDPDVVLRSDPGTEKPSVLVRGAATIAAGAVTYGHLARSSHAVLVNGAAGVVAVSEGRAISLMAFTVRHGRIVAIDALSDPERLGRLDLAALGL